MVTLVFMWFIENKYYTLKTNMTLEKKQPFEDASPYLLLHMVMFRSHVSFLGGNVDRFLSQYHNPFVSSEASSHKA